MIKLFNQIQCVGQITICPCTEIEADACSPALCKDILAVVDDDVTPSAASARALPPSPVRLRVIVTLGMLVCPALIVPCAKKHPTPCEFHRSLTLLMQVTQCGKPKGGNGSGCPATCAQANPAGFLSYRNSVVPIKGDGNQLPTPIERWHLVLQLLRRRARIRCGYHPQRLCCWGVWCGDRATPHRTRGCDWVA